MKKYLTLAIVFTLLTGNLTYAATTTSSKKGNPPEMTTEQLTKMGLTATQITSYQALTTQEKKMAYLKEIGVTMPTPDGKGKGGGMEMDEDKLTELGLTAAQITAYQALTTQEEKIAYLKEIGITMPTPSENGGGKEFDETKLTELGLTAAQITAYQALTTQEEKMAYLKEIGITMPTLDNSSNTEEEVNGRKLNLEKLGLTEAQITELKALTTDAEKKTYLENLGIEIPDNQSSKSKRFSDEGEIKNLEAVNFLQEKGIVSGSDDGNFNPDDSVNRAEAMKMILEAIGEDTDTAATTTSFTDVDSSAWYASYVKKAKELGVVSGYSDGSFKPAQTVNKAELLKMLLKAFDVDVSSITASDLYSDTPTTAWYASYLQYAKDKEIITAEDDGLFHPAKGMTRDEFADVIYKLMTVLGLNS